MPTPWPVNTPSDYGYFPAAYMESPGLVLFSALCRCFSQNEYWFTHDVKLTDSPQLQLLRTRFTASSQPL